jgi:hypothetical protein
MHPSSVIALLCVLLPAACDRTERAERATQPPAAPIQIAADTGLAGFFAHGPVAAGQSRGDLIAQFGEPDSIRAAAVPNRHDPSVTDSVFTLFYDGLTADVRRAGYDGREILASLSIASDRFLQDGAPIRIGSRLADVRSELGPPDEEAGDELIYICEECLAAGQETVRFAMLAGAVARIDLRYWVD